MRLFSPAVEPDFGQERFLTDSPWEILKSGDIADVPVIFGFSRDEALFMTPGKYIFATFYSSSCIIFRWIK